MKELLLENLPYIITACVGVCTALGTLIVSILNSKAKKAEYNTKLEEMNIQKLQIESKKLELEEMMIQGAFIICPQCGTKIKAKDMIFYTSEVKKDNEV